MKNIEGLIAKWEKEIKGFKAVRGQTKYPKDQAGLQLMALQLVGCICELKELVKE